MQRCLEALSRIRMQEYVDSCVLAYPQYAYAKGRGTGDAIAVVAAHSAQVRDAIDSQPLCGRRSAGSGLLACIRHNAAISDACCTQMGQCAGTSCEGSLGCMDCSSGGQVHTLHTGQWLEGIP